MGPLQPMTRNTFYRANSRNGGVPSSRSAVIHNHLAPTRDRPSRQSPSGPECARLPTFPKGSVRRPRIHSLKLVCSPLCWRGGLNYHRNPTTRDRVTLVIMSPVKTRKFIFNVL